MGWMPGGDARAVQAEAEERVVQMQLEVQQSAEDVAKMERQAQWGPPLGGHGAWGA